MRCCGCPARYLPGRLTDARAREMTGAGVEVFHRGGQLWLRCLSPVPAAVHFDLLPLSAYKQPADDEPEAVGHRRDRGGCRGHRCPRGILPPQSASRAEHTLKQLVWALPGCRPTAHQGAHGGDSR